MKKIYLILLVSFLLISAILVFYFLFSRSLSKTVSIDGKEFNVELARTSAKQEKGLMDRKNLDANAGMLFIFNKSSIETFWMKNTLIPLDIIFINNNKIVDMTTLDPESKNNIPQYTSKYKAKYVLEINAGLTDQYGFKIGDKVKINY